MRINTKKPVIYAIVDVLKIYDEYILEHKFTDGIGKHIENVLGISAQYAYVLRFYGENLRRLGRLEKAYKEKWVIRKIIAFIRMYEDEEFLKIKNDEILKIKNLPYYNEISPPIRKAIIDEKVGEIENMYIDKFMKGIADNKKIKK